MTSSVKDVVEDTARNDCGCCRMKWWKCLAEFCGYLCYSPAFEKFLSCDLMVFKFFSRYLSATYFRVHHLIFLPLREGPHHRQFI